MNMREIADLEAAVQSGEEVLASGLAVRAPVVVTTRRIIRAGHDAAVSIPFEAIHRCEYWFDAHRWIIRIIHSPIDPRARPCDAHQWWRIHDRRSYRRRVERMWQETMFRFSHEHTRAADAIWARLTSIGVDCVRLPDEPRTDRSKLRVPLTLRR